MTYKYFKETFVEQIEARIDEYVGKKCRIIEDHEEKVNDSVDALYIMTEGNNVGPTLYPKIFYKASCEGAPMNELVEMALETIKKGLREMPTVDMEMLRDYERVKGLISVDLISAEYNEKLLQTIPHQKFLDMAAVYRVNLDLGKEISGSMLITNQVLEHYGITPQQLHEDALRNSQLCKPPHIQGMCDLMARRTSEGMRPLDSVQVLDDDDMFVVTVPDKTKGAGVLLYENFLQSVAEKIGGDFYVLPASINEIILLRDLDGMNVPELKELVKEVNREEVQPKDRLTDNVYHYDSTNHLFEQGDAFEARRKRERAIGKEEKGSVLVGLKERQKVAEQKNAGEKASIEMFPKSRGGEAL
jgi:hypothetical protein